ncbi:nacht domain protein [Colletotrichum scovillei]|uniref:Nacht domain protein n=1 Tax=Colletotrichum scovillei TaxID=1209932 RepID=A0A9P7R4M9_9PEZI|nr:nacht domain protein [Colletotrichum scovillei]
MSSSLPDFSEPPDRGGPLRRMIRLGHPPLKAPYRPLLRDGKLSKLLEKTKPQRFQSMDEAELIESLKTLQEVQETGTDTTSSRTPNSITVDMNRDAWALDVTANPSLRNKFEQLRLAVNEYNIAATHEKREIVIKNGCELQDVLAQANAMQEDRSSSKDAKSLNSNIQAGLQQFCKSTLYYAAVMDTMAQHHPEWVSLAWGTMKMLLMIPIEYQKVKEGIVTNLGRIGSKLELVSLLLSFYPVERMTNAAAAIYASIADFLAYCLRYLRSNCLVKTFKTMVAPFDTRLGPILKTIDENYAILRQEAEIQFMIYQFQRHCSMQRDLSEIKEDHGRIIGILEDIIRRDDMDRERRSKTIDGQCQSGNANWKF